MTPDGPERRTAFCARLKLERERRGTSLRAIADTTKVKASLLEAMERGDVSRWPKGIYRRSFFREYVAAVGLPSEPYAAEFLELFPDGEEPPPAARPVGPAPAVPVPAVSPLRLTLAQEPGDGLPVRFGGATRYVKLSATQWLAAAADLVVVALGAAAIAASGRVSLALGAAGLACVYYSLGTAILGRSPMAWVLRRRAGLAPLMASQPAAAAELTVARSHAPGRSKVRSLVGQALRARSALRGYVAQLSHSAATSATSQRHRDLNQLRRRRVEAANSTADEAV